MFKEKGLQDEHLKYFVFYSQLAGECEVQSDYVETMEAEDDRDGHCCLVLQQEINNKKEDRYICLFDSDDCLDTKLKMTQYFKIKCAQ